MSSPDGLKVTTEAVIAELRSDTLGNALWERAQWKVIANAAIERMGEMEAEKGTPDVGWAVPSE
jgi:hypothetical protein